MSYNTRSEARMRYFRPSAPNYNDNGGYKVARPQYPPQQQGLKNPPRGGMGGGGGVRGPPAQQAAPPAHLPQQAGPPAHLPQPPAPPAHLPQPAAPPAHPPQPAAPPAHVPQPTPDRQPSPVPQQQPQQLPQSKPQPTPSDPSNYTQPAYSTQSALAAQPIPGKPQALVAQQEGSMTQPAQAAPNMKMEESIPIEEPLTEGGVEQEKRYGQRPWMRKVPFSMRASKKIRKRRQNARLRHLLSPKNAMTVLHELHPELKIVMTEQFNTANQMVYTVEIEIEGKTYKGHGMSKLAAKQAGCENALKVVLLEKMAKSSVNVKNPDDSMDVNETIKIEEQQNTPTEIKEGMESPEKSHPPKKQYAEDDVPWRSLASFALYKLFAEWQSQGFQFPPNALNIGNSQTFVFPKLPGGLAMAPMKKIPEDANQKHPVQLLNQLRPGSQYSETREGTPPNLTFTFTVTVDGQTYQGVGTTKKDAKKQCAKAALQALGVKYD